MTRTITIYLEDADGKTDEPTGIHVDNGDGTASWVTGAALDAIIPAGSPRALRGNLRRLRDDVAPLPRSVPKVRKVAPTVAEFVAGEAP